MLSELRFSRSYHIRGQQLNQLVDAHGWILLGSWISGSINQGLQLIKHGSKWFKVEANHWFIKTRLIQELSVMLLCP